MSIEVYVYDSLLYVFYAKSIALFRSLV